MIPSQTNDRSSSAGRRPPRIHFWRLPDIPLIRIPSTSATRKGFQEWILSNGRSKDWSMRYVAGQIRVQLLDSNVTFSLPASAVATLDGFRDWATSDDCPECGHFSYLQAEVVIDMSAEELETHAKLKAEVSRGIMNLNDELDFGEFYPDGTRVTNVEVGLSADPDATLVKWETSEAGRVVMVPRRDRPGQYRELRGTPDWVMEVVSLWSGKKDKKDLYELYFRAGVPEYWLIDALGANIEFQIFVWHPDGYVAVKPKRGWHHSPLFGRSFRLSRRRNRASRWRYKLHVRAVPQS